LSPAAARAVRVARAVYIQNYNTFARKNQEKKRKKIGAIFLQFSA
jgi:hypothetical protein